MLNRGIKYIYKVIYLVECILFFLFFINTVISDNFFSVPLKYRIIIISIFFLLVIIFINKNIEIVSALEKIVFKYKYLLFFILIIYQIFIVKSLTTFSGFDTYGIRTLAAGNSVNTGALKYYFSYNPNNLLLFYIEKIIFKFCIILHVKNFLLALNFVNLLCIDTAFIVSHLILKRNYVKGVNRFAFYLLWVFFLLSPWSIITYSDTIVLPFVCLFSLLIMSIFINHNVYSNIKIIMMSVSAGILLFFSYNIKPTTIIILAALLISFFIYELVNKIEIKTLIVICLSVTISFGIFETGYKMFNQKQTIVSVDKNYQMTWTHFMMMGLNDSTNGAFSDSDAKKSESKPNVQERESLNKRIIFKRLKKFGFAGYIKFILKKDYFNTNDGTLGWGREGQFLLGNFNKNEIVRSIFYPNGSRIGIYTMIAQLVWIFTSVGVLTSLLKKGDFFINVYKLTIVGTMLFLLLFEGGRTRYLIQALPFIFFISAYGWNNIFKHMTKLVSK